MKPKYFVRPVLITLVFGNLAAPVFATPSSAYPDGFFFNSPGMPNWSSYLTAWDANTPAHRTIELSSYTGGLYLFSGNDESLPGVGDGGINIQGNPISLVLSSNSTNPDNANLNIWKASTWGIGQPLLNINALNGNTTFTNSNVAINSGTLSVGGSLVLTAASAPTTLTSNGFINTSNFGSVLANSTPPNSIAWTNAFVPRGNTSPLPGLTESGLLALGNSTASGERSIASGYGSNATNKLAIALGAYSTASGEFSTAIGQNAVASGLCSLAVGNGVTASGYYSIASGYNSSSTGYYCIAAGSNSIAAGTYSFARGYSASAVGLAANAMGWGTSARARAETAIGNYNLESNPISQSAINGLYGLFRVGNGVTTLSRSDAMTVLMNGQTTLTNKAWKANVAADPTQALVDPPASDTDSGGNALVVDGHTVLNGKVIISVPQGDISMGIYGAN